MNEGRIVRILWKVLTVIVLLLFALAVVLLIKSDVLSTKYLTDSQAKNLWAFLGVSFGAVVTLIGALLTEQHKRRTDVLARETEDRLKIDTVAKVLELVTVEGQYAPRARVAGAIATLMRLGGGDVGVRILGELWTDNAVDSPTAIWLIDHILQDRTSGKAETEQAAYVLRDQASRLLPTVDDPHQDWNLWPDTLNHSWPTTAASQTTRNNLMEFVTKTILARDIAYWARGGFYGPFEALVRARNDPDVGMYAARAFDILYSHDAFKKIKFPVDDRDVKQIRDKLASPSGSLYPWAQELLVQLSQWAKGEQKQLPHA